MNKRRGRPPGTSKSKDDGLKIDKKVVFNVLRSFLSQSVASRLAGYSESSNNYGERKGYEGTVQEIRQRIQADDRFGFLRQLEFYAGMRDDEDKAASDRIAAAKQLDTVAGYNAPQKVEMNQRRTLVEAVVLVRGIAERTGLSPMALKKALEDMRGVPGEVGQGPAAEGEYVVVSRETQEQGVIDG